MSRAASAMSRSSASLENSVKAASHATNVSLEKAESSVSLKRCAKVEARATTVAATVVRAMADQLSQALRLNPLLREQTLKRREPSRPSIPRGSARHATVATAKAVRTKKIELPATRKNQLAARPGLPVREKHHASRGVKEDPPHSSRRVREPHNSLGGRNRGGQTGDRDQINLKTRRPMRNLILPLAVACIALLTSCDPSRVYEQNVELPEKNWTVDNALAFEFAIEDTTKRYNVHFNVRYSLAYDYYNLYLRHRLIAPDSSEVSSELHELHLMDAKTGKPQGKGSSDIYDLQSLALKDVAFAQTGTYKLQLTQYMRRDPLPNVLAVGVRVEEVSQ